MMGNNSSLMLQEDEIEQISEETGFSRNQIVRLYSRFLSLDKRGRGYLDRDDFLRIPELAINPLCDRIVDGFFIETIDSEQRINFRNFIRVLALFRPINGNKPHHLNSRDAKLKFAFSMYDINDNGSISKDEFQDILFMMVGENITEEQLQNIAQRTINEADHDKDGRISFQEFRHAMDKTDIEQKMSIVFLN